MIHMGLSPHRVPFFPCMQANPDSRAFGPLPFENILGRAVYYLRTRTVHGQVVNSDAAAAFDEPVLGEELDVEKMGVGVK